MWMFYLALALIALIAWAVNVSNDADEWCDEMDEFYRDYPYDSNPTLSEEYAWRCE